MHFAVSLLNLRPGLIGGTETYIRRTLAEFHKHLHGDHVTLIASREIQDVIRFQKLNVVLVPHSQKAIVKERILEATLGFYRSTEIEHIIDNLKTDAIFFPQQSIFPKIIHVPTVMTVVDIQHLISPRDVPYSDRVFRKLAYPASLHRADSIICISDYTRKTLHNLCGIRPSKTRTIPLGISTFKKADFPPHQIASEFKYLFYPANSYPHKNHETLIRTLAILKKRDQLPWKMIFTGQQTGHWPRINRLIGRLGLRQNVKHLGYLPYDEIRRLYAGAEAVLFPTKFEGFGLPVIEATEFKRKVIVSRLEVFDEIGVPKEWQIDFSNPDQLHTALNLPGVTELKFHPITWSETARLTLETLRATATAHKR